jgi:hypothetical protein
MGINYKNNKQSGVKMKYLLAIVGAAALAGCMSIDPTPFRGPDGKQAYSMKCSGFGRTLDACYQKAGEVCPSGYSIVDRSSGTVGFMNQGNMMMAPQHGLVIQCK